MLALILLVSTLAIQSLCHTAPRHYQLSAENPNDHSSRATLDEFMRTRALDVMSTAYEVTSAGLGDYLARGPAKGLSDDDNEAMASASWLGKPHFCRFADLVNTLTEIGSRREDGWTMAGRCCETLVRFRTSLGDDGEELVRVVGMIWLTPEEEGKERQWVRWDASEVEHFFPDGEEWVDDACHRWDDAKERSAEDGDAGLGTRPED
jgi:hypothetical protein